MRALGINIFTIPVILGVAGIFFSCVNDLERIKEVSSIEHAPDEASRNLNVIYTDSGYAKLELTATIAESYNETQKTKLKDGLKVKFFNDNGEVVSILTALYGEIDKNTGDMFVRDSVELKNVEQNKILKSEELIWDKKGDSVYTEKAVTITYPNMILYGQGAKTNRNFDTAFVYNVKARVNK
ncbi:LPS export ABC transporter periplasmic protein LptC [Lishizhenia sp.]|uniref:LPS export ABC transporter periplasmic protein LptC n=1 Tax=Lishizhenia sp. TaxID=2497594 RepID=UPI00299E43E1|nr:LPS export ABC transporter periplasmic protein LptC [Lishizhenia sp.]MDX1446904.1 LPS export ABC transporter periplasmic protein LptC [Lishizhenia sp.]